MECQEDIIRVCYDQKNRDIVNKVKQHMSPNWTIKEACKRAGVPQRIYYASRTYFVKKSKKVDRIQKLDELTKPGTEPKKENEVQFSAGRQCYKPQVASLRSLIGGKGKETHTQKEQPKKTEKEMYTPAEQKRPTNKNELNDMLGTFNDKLNRARQI